jgi:hypothetical protein
MQTSRPTILASAKRSAKLGVQIALFVLGPICIVVWLALIAGVFYKSYSLGISPVDFLRLEIPDHPGSPTYLAMLLRVMLLCLAVAIYGILMCAAAGGAIGAVAGFVARRSRSADNV